MPSSVRKLRRHALLQTRAHDAAGGSDPWREKSSEVAVATTVAYAKKMGKTPVVVNDCPGFLVNRVLFPYFGGFAKLVSAGGDFVRIDKVMEKFGWPMGPAYLMDVVGIDTGHHGRDVMAEGFPDRMKDDRRSARRALRSQAPRAEERKGSTLRTDKGKKKVADPRSGSAKPTLRAAKSPTNTSSLDDDPLCLETVLCLKTACETAAERHVWSRYRFPSIRGGAALHRFCRVADRALGPYAYLGALYHPLAKLRKWPKRPTVLR